MNNVLIDPHILLLDLEYSNNPTVAEKFIDVLIDAQSLHYDDKINPLITENAIYFFDQYMDYPHWDKIKQFLSANGLQDYYQPQDILNAFQKVLSSRTIESELNIQEVLFEQKIFSISGACDSEFEEIKELQKTIMYTSLTEKLTGPTFLFSKKNFSVEMQYEVLEIEPTRNDLEIPYNKSDNIYAYSDISGIYEKIDCLKLWKSIDYNFFSIESKNIIEIYITQNKMDVVNDFTFGEEFIGYLKKNNFISDNTKIKMLFRALSEVISETYLEKTHSLRTNSSGDSKQRMVNDFKAYRHDIDREYHLHYWKKENQVIFASLGPHNQFEIPNPL